ncbi:MAG TPA: OmpA family protein [Rhizobacter sp.]|nr:OmpA family protein [Rhizobacter sp.]
MTQATSFRPHRLLFLFSLWLSALALAGCAAKATLNSNELPFEEAVATATDGLVSQTQKLPGFLAKVESKLAKRAFVLDPMLDAGTGQQTGATKLLEKRVTERLTSKYDQFEVLAFQSSNLSKTQYLLTGTMTRETGASGKPAMRINLALTDLKSGNVVAQSGALAKEEGLDNNPLPYYRDSPVLVKDKVIEGYVRTTATPPGQAGDSFYLERISTATVINEATTLYNTERYQESLGQYRSALATPAGEQLRAVNGVYLTSAKLGRTAEAEQAFGRVVAMGIAYNELGVKFLFNPGSTEFWSDSKVSGPYGMWLRQIAKEATAAKVCMNVVGHTSKTGSEPANDALSKQRAAYIRQRLSAEAAELGARTKASGMGFRQNIVGSGTDNAVDALDRRVEFKIIPCG